jgi:hypothetical protein
MDRGMQDQKKGDGSLGVVSGWCRDSLDNELSSIASGIITLSRAPPLYRRFSPLSRPLFR